MRILVFHWRDIRNPAHGGAEVYTHENSKRWVKTGNEVTHFSAAFPGCRKKEEIDGIDIIRSGNRFTVYSEARKFYRKRFKGKFDIVVDEVNTLPFFTPFYIKEPKVMLIHQLAREIWFHETRFPLNIFGYLSEPIFLRLYRKMPTITVSESTRNDLHALGFSDVYIVRNAVKHKPVSKAPKKNGNPTLIWAGRIKRSKRIHDIIEALGLVRKEGPKIKLFILGRGDEDYIKNLKCLAKKRGLAADVIFTGYVSEKKKMALMKAAHAVVAASVREGWGINVIEGNTMGTPAITYNIKGYRDSIQDRKTGLLTEETPRALADAFLEFFSSQALRQRLCRNALKWSRQFSWDKSGRQSLKILTKITGA